jgi:hypothetical protein
VTALAVELADVHDRYGAEAREAAFHLRYALHLASRPIEGYALHPDDAARIAHVLEHATHLIATARLAAVGSASEPDGRAPTLQ